MFLEVAACTDEAAGRHTYLQDGTAVSQFIQQHWQSSVKLRRAELSQRQRALVLIISTASSVWRWFMLSWAQTSNLQHEHKCWSDTLKLRRHHDTRVLRAEFIKSIISDDSVIYGQKQHDTSPRDLQRQIVKPGSSIQVNVLFYLSLISIPGEITAVTAVDRIMTETDLFKYILDWLDQLIQTDKWTD